MSAKGDLLTVNFDDQSSRQVWNDLIESNPKFLALNLGCGSTALSGFINLDFNNNSASDIDLDLNTGLPAFLDSAVDLIYSEHLFEQLDNKSGAKLLADCYRSLKSGGKLRIATPDLDQVLYKYSINWKNQAWLNKKPWSETVMTKGQMLNTIFRECGSCYLYNEEDLNNLLVDAGFKDVTRFQFGCSAERRFWNLEVHQESTLILEAIKP